MRIVIQRVKRASVEIDGGIYNAIKQGLLVLVGIEDADIENDIEWIAKKIINLRIFNDNEGVMNCSLLDIKGELLLISQFTLHALTKKGNRPSYIKASKPEVAVPVYEKLIDKLEEGIPGKVKTGIFGADMKLDLINDGPVTIFMDSKNKE